MADTGTVIEACEGKQKELSVTRFFTGVLTGCFSVFLMTQVADKAQSKKPEDKPIRLGKFSVSLTVKDLAKSREFYEKLGFTVTRDETKKNWLVLQNETATIGLFQGMFDKNMMTFNPGWDRTSNPLPDFDDVRDVQKVLKSRGLALATAADESTTGPAFLTVTDPDGNQILVDQHVPRPKK